MKENTEAIVLRDLESDDINRRNFITKSIFAGAGFHRFQDRDDLMFAVFALPPWRSPGVSLENLYFSMAVF